MANLKLSQVERLAMLETKVDTVLDRLDKMDTKLDLLLPTFVTHQQLAEKLDSLEAIVNEKGATKWRDRVLWMIFSGLIAALLTYVLTQAGIK